MDSIHSGGVLEGDLPRRDGGGAVENSAAVPLLSGYRSRESVMIHQEAVIGEGCVIGAFSVIGPRVQLAAGVRVGSFCSLGVDPDSWDDPLVIGPGCIIRSHTSIYRGVKLAQGVHTGHHVMIREGVTIDESASIGTGADLQPAVQVRARARLHSGVFLAPGTVVGEDAWLMPGVATLNDPHPPSEVSTPPTIGERAVLGARSVLLPGVTIGADAVVGAGSVVTKSVQSGHLVVGHPAADRGLAGEIRHRVKQDEPAYPWTYSLARNTDVQ